MRSRSIAEDFLRAGPRHQRLSVRCEQIIERPAEEVFPLLCPTREFDWIEGWRGELLYTESGYAERDCIFSLPAAYSLDPVGLSGADIWTVSRYEPNERIDYVRVMGSSAVEHLRIFVSDGGDRTSTVTWDVTFTGLDEAGDRFVDNLPAKPSPMADAMARLDHYLRTGERMRSETALDRIEDE